MKDLEINIRKLLDKLYEAEALAELALRRIDTPAAVSMARLLMEKCNHIASETDSWNLPQEETAKTSSHQPLYDSSVPPSSSFDSKTEEEDDIALAENEMEEIMAMASAEPEKDSYSQPADSVKNLEYMTAELDPEIKETADSVGFNPPKGFNADNLPESGIDKDVPPHEVEFIEEEDLASNERKGDEQNKKSVSSRQSELPLLSFFTVNDRFRFRRTLFNGNNRDFMDSLSIIETLESPQQAWDYLYDDLQWNPEDEEVKHFRSAVEKYFKALTKN